MSPDPRAEDPLARAAQSTLLAPERPGPGRLAAAGLSIALLLALLIWLLPRATQTGWAEIGATLTSAPPAATALAIGAGVLCVLVGALPLTAIRTEGGARVALGRAVPLHAAGTGISLLVPGGGLLAAGLQALLLRRAGARLVSLVSVLAAVAVVETVLTTALVPVLGLLAYAVLAGTTSAPGLGLAALAAVLLLAVTLGLGAMVVPRKRFASVVGGALEPLASTGALPVWLTPDVLLEIHERVRRLLRREPLRLVLPPMLVLGLQALVLLVAVRALDPSIPVSGILAVFALGRVLALLPLTPGGAGITETAAAVLLVQMGMEGAAAASAVLISLLTSLLVPLACAVIAAGPLVARRG